MHLRNLHESLAPSTHRAHVVLATAAVQSRCHARQADTHSNCSCPQRFSKAPHGHLTLAVVHWQALEPVCTVGQQPPACCLLLFESAVFCTQDSILPRPFVSPSPPGILPPSLIRILTLDSPHLSLPGRRTPRGPCAWPRSTPDSIVTTTATTATTTHDTAERHPSRLNLSSAIPRQAASTVASPPSTGRTHPPPRYGAAVAIRPPHTVAVGPRPPSCKRSNQVVAPPKPLGARLHFAWPGFQPAPGAAGGTGVDIRASSTARRLGGAGVACLHSDPVLRK